MTYPMPSVMYPSATQNMVPLSISSMIVTEVDNATATQQESNATNASEFLSKLYSPHTTRFLISNLVFAVQKFSVWHKVTTEKIPTQRRIRYGVNRAYYTSDIAIGVMCVFVIARRKIIIYMR